MKNFITSLAFSAISASAVAADYWQKIPVPVTKNLLSVSFGSKSAGFISGADSTLLKTTNGGKTWVSIKVNGMAFTALAHDITDIRFFSENVGFAIVGNQENPLFNGVLHKTNDGGITWSVSETDITCQALYFFDQNNGFAAGSKFFSGKNVNRLSAGVWQSAQNFSYDPSQQLHSIDFFNKNVGITAGDSGYVYRTFNAGISWDTVKTNIDTSINDIKYLNENTIIAATNNFGSSIIISKDKGLTWNFDISSATFFYPYFKAVARSAKDSLIMTGTSITTGKGILFYFEKPFMTIFQAEENLNNVALSDDSTAFVVGDKGLLLSNRKEGAGISETPAADTRITIFPNPSSGTFTVNTAFPHTISIYNCLGQLIFEDPNRNTSRIINLSGRAVGFYFADIISEDGSTSTKKLLLQ